MARDKAFIRFVRENLSLARVFNRMSEYGPEDLTAAKKCFTEKDLLKFENPEYVVNAIAALIKSININKQTFQVQASDGRKWKQHHKELADTDRLMKLFIENQITEIEFKGIKKDDVIKLSGDGINNIRNLFLDWYATEEYQDLINPELEAIQSNSKLANQMVIEREAETEKKLITNYRYSIAFHLSEFLKSQTKESYISIIGKVLNETKMLDTEYINSADNSTIKTLIKRGKELLQ